MCALALFSTGCTIDGIALLEGGDEVADESETRDVDEHGEPSPGTTESDGQDEGSSDQADDATEGTDEVTDEAASEEGAEDTGVTQEPLCRPLTGDIDGYLPCKLPNLATSVKPELRWAWMGEGVDDSIVTTPLVANLDDDNGDQRIDLCDTPDVLVAALALPGTEFGVWPDAHLYVIDGRTGQTSRKFVREIDGSVNPAIADLDGDGVPEVIALESAIPNSPFALTSRRLIAFEASGELAWEGDYWHSSQGGGAIAVADLDGDGSPEILAPQFIARASGELLWAPPSAASAYSMPVAVDLDLDGEMEVLFGASAYSHTGELRFHAGGIAANEGSVAIANFDADPFPEIYVQHEGVHGIFEHDGTLKSACPVGGPLLGTRGNPVSALDLDGDGSAEILFAYQGRLHLLRVVDGVCTLGWSIEIDGGETIASGTMFDFLGDGVAEVVYADRSELGIYASDGSTLLKIPRSARESISNPVVADVDGDGAAELLVASSLPLDGPGELPTPTLMLLGAEMGGFVPSRRVWNQHGYHYGNISEVSRVPTHEVHDWDSVTSFRANRRLDPGERCIP